jgi:hypothetical protein
MTSPLDDPDIRARILGALSAGHVVNAIASEHGLSPHAVRRLQRTLIPAPWMANSNSLRGLGVSAFAVEAPVKNPNADRERLRRTASLFSAFALRAEVEYLRAKHALPRPTDAPGYGDFGAVIGRLHYYEGGSDAPPRLRK